VLSQPGVTLLSMYIPPWSGEGGDPGALMVPLTLERERVVSDGVGISKSIILPGDSVGVRRSDDALLVHIADSEPLRDGEVVWNVLACEVSPGPRRVGDHPVVILVAIESSVVCIPAIGATVTGQPLQCSASSELSLMRTLPCTALPHSKFLQGSSSPKAAN
jgi:hypothetical protein